MSIPPSPPPLPLTAGEHRELLPFVGWLRRNRHISVPAAVPPGFLAAGEALAHLPQSPGPTVAAAAVGGLAMWWAAPHKWTDGDGKPRRAEVYYARLSALAAGGFLSWTAITGLHLPQLAASAPLALAWGIPWWWHKRPRRHGQEVTQQWQEWWAHYASRWPNLFGSQVEEVTTAGVIDTLKIQLVAGRQHLKDVQQILGLLESALQGHVESGMTRCETVRGNPSKVLVHLKRANPHDGTVEWDAALAPESVTGLAPLGKNEAGEWEYGPLLNNWFVIGRLRSGKSNEQSVLLAAWTGCADALPPWMIDLKGGRSARPWAVCADWIATTVEEARLLEGCAVAELKARAEHCYTGQEQNVPTPEAPAILVSVDEAHNVLSTMSGDMQCQQLFAVLVSEGAAVNVHGWTMTQHGALHESVGTEQIRANMPCRMCFAVSEAAHGQFALPDWAKLDASKLENKGEFYYRVAHDSSSAPLRGPHMSHDLVREIAARNAQIERPPLRLFCGDQVAYTTGYGDNERPVTWQEVYDTRWERLPASFRRASAAATPPEETVTTSPEPPATPAVPCDSSGRPLPDWAAAALERVNDDIASVPDLPDPPQVDEEALRRTMEGQKQLWCLSLQFAAAGITPRQLKEASRLGNSWTHLYLGELVKMGVITKESRGHYKVVPGHDVSQAVKAIEHRTSQLTREAQEMVSAR